MYTEIGRYKVDSFLGEGGAGQVYKALDPKVNRFVAIKLLTANSPEQRSRFLQEAEVLANLEHPNIVPIYDFGEEDGRPYIVMRFISGGTLHDKIQMQNHDRRLTYGEIVEIISKVSKALDFAHQGGIGHRDIKPANILFDDRNEPLIADFGLSKLFTSATASGPTLDKILGTPHYMSPEQGRGQPLDHLTDIYSLGIILFEICNGRVPYDAEEPLGIIYKHVQEPVPKMSHLPKEIESVISKAMAKLPKDRYQSAGDMATALQHAVITLTSKIPPKRSSLIVPKNNGIPFWGILAGSGLLLVALVLFFAFRGDSTPPNDPATQVPIERPENTQTAGLEIFDDVSTETPKVIATEAIIEPTSTISNGSAFSSTDTLLTTNLKAQVTINRENVEIYSGPGGEGFDSVSTAGRGDILDLVALSRDRNWVLIETSTGLKGWVISTAVSIIDNDQNIEVAITEPAPDIILTLTSTTIASTSTPIATATAVFTSTPLPALPTATPQPVNPFDLDLDGVIHNPNQGQYDLCENKAGPAHNCGCPDNMVPAACSGGGGDSGGGDSGGGDSPPPLP